MKSAFFVFWFVAMCHAYGRHILHRKLLLQYATMYKMRMSTLCITQPKVLVLSCGSTGRAIAQVMKQNGHHVTIATTKPKRVSSLNQICDNVVVIPQIETKEDEELTNCLVSSNYLVMADTIKIFSPHTYVRTAKRVKTIIEKHAWEGSVGLISSENAYGNPRRGEELRESGVIYSSLMNRTQWKLNTNIMALQIRHAENMILSSTPKSFVFRTAGIWDENKFFNVASFTAKKEFNEGVGNSWMTLTTTNLISHAVLKAFQKEAKGIYNVANFPPMRRKDFLRSLHCMYGMENTKWTDKELDMDVMFSTDPDPYLPSSQRSNSRLRCEKIQKILE